MVNARGRGMRGGTARVAGHPAARTRAQAAPAEPWPMIVVTPALLKMVNADRFDGREIGGFLYGPADVPDGQIVITEAIVASREDERTRTSVVLDVDEALRYWNDLPADMTLRGDWHQHPNDDHANAGPADLRSWERSAEAFNRTWVGLIVRTAPENLLDLDGRPVEVGSFEMGATAARAEGGSVRHSSVPIVVGRP